MNLYTKTASGKYRQARNDEVIDAASHIRADRIRGVQLTHPRATHAFAAQQLGAREHEVFALILLDNRNAVISWTELFRGTIDGATVHPREVVKRCLIENAAAVILVHNHPSGVGEPSQADELITRRVKDALSTVDIRVLDHLVVAGDSVESFAERGLL